MRRRKIPLTPQQIASREEAGREFRAQLAESERLTRLLDASFAEKSAEKTRAALAAGANPEVRDAMGRVALSRAILRDALDCALAVLEAFPLQAERATQEGETPFACACRRGHAALAIRLAPAAKETSRRFPPRRLSGPVLAALLSGDAPTMSVALAHGDFWSEAKASLSDGYGDKAPGMIPEALASAARASISPALATPSWASIDAALAWMALEVAPEPWQKELRSQWESAAEGRRRSFPALFPQYGAALEKRALQAAIAAPAASTPGVPQQAAPSGERPAEAPLAEVGISRRRL